MAADNRSAATLCVFLDAYLRAVPLVYSPLIGAHISHRRSEGFEEGERSRTLPRAAWGLALFILAYTFGRALASASWRTVQSRYRGASGGLEPALVAVAALQFLSNCTTAPWLMLLTRFCIGFVSNMLTKLIGPAAASAAESDDAQEDDFGFRIRAKSSLAFAGGLVAGVLAGAGSGLPRRLDADYVRPTLTPSVLSLVILAAMALSVRLRRTRRKPSAAAAMDAAAAAAAAAGGIPQRFLAAEGGDVVKAKQRFEATTQWRRDAGIERLLAEPGADLRRVKAVFPHWLHGRSRRGNVVRFERLGAVSPEALRGAGLDADGLVRHTLLLNEFVFERLDASRADARVLVVVDAMGCGVASLKGEVLAFMQRSAALMQAHYPERMEAMVVVNAPFWFASAFGLVAKLLAPQTRDRIRIAGTSFAADLDRLIAADELPPEYGGTGPPLGAAPEERALLSFVDALAQGTPAALAAPPAPAAGSGAAPGGATAAAAAAVAGGGGAGGGGGGGAGAGAQESWTDALYGLFRRPPQANLGEDNRFVFDHRSQQWVLEGGGGDLLDEPRGRTLSTDDEVRVISAIQAAHWQSQLLVVETLSTSLSLRGFFSGDLLRAVGRNGGEAAPRWMGLAAAFLYGATACAQAGLECAVAFWLACPASHGGLSFSQPRAGAAASLAVVSALLLLRFVLPPSARTAARTEPIRALRIGCATSLGALTLLLVLPKYATYPYDRSLLVLAALPPAVAMLALGSMLARSAAAVLFIMAARGEAEHRHRRLKVVATAADLCGPMAAGRLLFVGLRSPSVAFPFDANYALVAAGLALLLVYVLSLLLHVKIVGVVSDRLLAEGEKPRGCEVLTKVLAISLEDVTALADEEAPGDAKKIAGKSVAPATATKRR